MKSTFVYQLFVGLHTLASVVIELCYGICLLTWTSYRFTLYTSDSAVNFMTLATHCNHKPTHCMHYYAMVHNLHLRKVNVRIQVIGGGEWCTNIHIGTPIGNHCLQLGCASLYNLQKCEITRLVLCASSKGVMKLLTRS